MQKRDFAGLPKSRTQSRIDNNLGIISGDSSGGRKIKRWRSDRLHRLDQYFEGKQYDHLPAWDQAPGMDFIPIRQRRPRINYKFGQRLANEIAAMLFGTKRFPRLYVEGDSDMSTYLTMMLKASKLQSKMVDLARHLVVCGSAFLRFFFVENGLSLEVYSAKHCYPKLDALGNLEEIEIMYTYKDEADVDDKGNAVEKWVKIYLSKDVDILFDNPPFDSKVEPVFEEVNRTEHGLGFVQGEWLRINEKVNDLDGDSLLDDVLDFIDELNYNLSQSSQAIAYNQEPQATFSGMDVNEIEALIRSSQKGWDLGRDGKAAFLESNLGAVKTADEFRDRARLAIQDITRIIMLDPEKMSGHAQSGKAMENLMAPMVNLIEELRPAVETRIVSIISKLAFINLMIIDLGAEAPVMIPPGWQPSSWNVIAEWPPVYNQTMADLSEKVRVATTVSGASLVSRDTLTRWLARDFGIEDIEAELERIAIQPVINPFAAF